jgi:hypothetical protein
MGSDDQSVSTVDPDREDAAKFCHPEAHGRRGTSQALNRFSVTLPIYVMSRVAVESDAICVGEGVLRQPRSEAASGNRLTRKRSWKSRMITLRADVFAMGQKSCGGVRISRRGSAPWIRWSGAKENRSPCLRSTVPGSIRS